MLEKLEELSTQIGHTRLKKLNYKGANVFAKLEYLNNSGSIKDRAAMHIMKSSILSGEITKDTTIIESSSGNFAIALATICKEIGLRFIPVVDPNINQMNLEMIEMLTDHQEMVTDLDCTGGYLLSRIQRVKELCSQIENSFWPNQYENPENAQAYELTLTEEIKNSFEQLDYVFIAVSSGGTIMGLTKGLKKAFPNIKVIGVDIEGSVIFHNKPLKRFVSGLGASKVPKILDKSRIDDVVIATHHDIIEGCIDLFKNEMIFAGASSGAVYHAVQTYFAKNECKGQNAVIICPDRGYSYQNTIFNKEWAAKFAPKQEEKISIVI
jgi:2,3-diaminopropionate biosynthesis protein SbnA